MPNVPATRLRARTISRGLKSDPHALIAQATSLALNSEDQLAFELFRAAPKAVVLMTPKQIDRLLPVLHDWQSTDCFASFVSGVAWREGVLTDAHILKWTKSPNLWTRRAALVSTVPLNLNARGSTSPKGEPRKTLAICSPLINDHENMIVKAMTWALRTLAAKDPKSVSEFLKLHEQNLAARVLRETRNKLRTGLKNPQG